MPQTTKVDLNILFENQIIFQVVFWVRFDLIVFSIGEHQGFNEFGAFFILLI